MKGKLIVFEGTDGSGKATQSRLLCDELTRRMEAEFAQLSGGKSLPPAEA